MEKLNDYMLIFRMRLNPDYHPSVEEMASMKQNWGKWIGDIAQKARLVSSHQLGFDGAILSSDGQNTSGYLIESNASVSGNLVLKAETLEEAIQMSSGCPILAMGGSIEVRNTLNIF